MKLENQVCTLEQAITLSELGIQPDENTFFYHRHLASRYLSIVARGNNCTYTLERDLGEVEWSGAVAAFTVSEIAAMLPDDITTERHTDNEWAILDDEGILLNIRNQTATMIESFAVALIFCLEQKLITPEECNNRLAAA